MIAHPPQPSTEASFDVVAYLDQHKHEKEDTRVARQPTSTRRPTAMGTRGDS